MSSNQAVYFFGEGSAEGDAGMRELLGGKGAGLAEMTNIGIPVPPGFTITTEQCIRFYEGGRTLDDSVKQDVLGALGRVEKALGRRFGDPKNPLLVSVRSGSRASMPGMMDTVLNLGLNDATVQGLIEQSGNERFGWDSYRRFIQMFGSVVLGVEHHEFEKLLDQAKQSRGVQLDTELDADALQELVHKFKDKVQTTVGKAFPDDPQEQLWTSIASVFDSWFNDRAYSYRRMNRIPHDWGTAANVQAMVFGNLGEDCATGVAFTRDPSTGEPHFYGEYLTNAQGEDVVAGIRTPLPLAQGQADAGSDAQSLQELMPKVYEELNGFRRRLESHYKDMQDLEFTVERGRLWMLQTRAGKRTGNAALRIATDMVSEGLLDSREALLLVDPDLHLDQLFHPRIDPNATAVAIARGLNASPGAASGRIVLTAEEAVHQAEAGEAVILVRTETSPEDIEGMAAARAILTARGGRTSHAAVVARGMGKTCVAGCSALTVDNKANVVRFATANGERVLQAGDVITVDGTSGDVYDEAVPTVEPELSENYETLMQWADETRQLHVRTNADTPADAKAAREFGAQGIGLCRTEHMFFGEDRLPWVRKMILAENETERREALARLEPMQKADFTGILEAMDELPVTIRLLDPPLHEFVPHTQAEAADLGGEIGIPGDVIWRRSEALREMNPMLGHRGCRLGVTYPEIYEMQVRAILAAAKDLVQKGRKPQPEIMLPLIGTVEEYVRLHELVMRIAQETLGDAADQVTFLVGTMIEIPRAALLADRIAQHAQFFSFGTNDLTQLVFGYSRDDAGTFLPDYVRLGILSQDPFEALDQEGVGSLVRMATEKGRSVKADLKVGICGEHGGDPRSIQFFHDVGLNYVSCSPFRVPIARLAAAQATIRRS